MKLLALLLSWLIIGLSSSNSLLFVLSKGLNHCCFDFLIHVVAEVMLGVENKVAHFGEYVFHFRCSIIGGWLVGVPLEDDVSGVEGRDALYVA